MGASASLTTASTSIKRSAARFSWFSLIQGLAAANQTCVAAGIDIGALLLHPRPPGGADLTPDERADDLMTANESLVLGSEHVGITVADLDRSSSLFCDVLGFEVMR